ncbi:hypothetical protein HMPREF9120_01497, partial [Neisseria sp. oral taxon 020 str. F0370]
MGAGCGGGGISQKCGGRYGCNAKRPHPDPPPQAGEGANGCRCFACGRCCFKPSGSLKAFSGCL